MAKVLIIDDDPLVRETIALMLSLNGHQVATAENGRQGIETFQTDSFDVVILDIVMPEMEGLETIRRLRDMTAEVPLIAITGTPVSIGSLGNERPMDYLAYARSFGAREALRKPFEEEQLLAAIDDALSSRVG